jgi:hypothetical protein
MGRQDHVEAMVSPQVGHLSLRTAPKTCRVGGIVSLASELDNAIADATPQLQAAEQLWRPGTFEAIVMAVLLAHEKRPEQIRMCLATMRTEEHLPQGNLLK